MQSPSSTKQPSGPEWGLLFSLIEYLILAFQPSAHQPKQLTYESISSPNDGDSFEYELTLVFIHLASKSQLRLPTVDDNSCQMKLSSLCELLDKLANLSVLGLLDTNVKDQTTSYKRLRQLLKHVQVAKRALNLIRGRFGPAFQLPPESSLAVDTEVLKDINRFFASIAPLARSDLPRSIKKVEHAFSDDSGWAIREYAVVTFDTVFRYLKTCKATHNVMFGLPATPGNPGTSKGVVLDAFISVCPDHTKWQEARFGACQLKSRAISNHNLCRVIEECQSDQQGLLLHIIESKLRNFSHSYQPRRHKLEHPSQSLYSLLTDHLLQRESIEGLKPGRWSRTQRKLLVSTMAQALAYIFESPWMRKEWTSKGIFFGPEPKTSDKSQLPLGPFVLCSAGGPKLPDDDKWWQQLPRAPSLILFGMMIMEIDLGQSLENEVNKRIQGGNNLWPALTGIWEEQKNDLEYPELILACLKFHKEYMQESMRQEEEEEEEEQEEEPREEEQEQKAEKVADKESMESWARNYILECIIPKLDNPTQGQPSTVQDLQDLNFLPEVLLSLSPPPQPESNVGTATRSSDNDVSLAHHTTRTRVKLP